MSTSSEKSGMTEPQWLACTNPLLMPKQFEKRPRPRKCALLSCAYVLSSPAAFQNPFARQVAETIQREAIRCAPDANPLSAFSTALKREFPTDLAQHWYGFAVLEKRFAELGRERHRLGVFLGAMTGRKAPSRGAVNVVATHCLSDARADARMQAYHQLDTIRAAFAPKPPEVVKVAPLPPRPGWRGLLDRLFPPHDWVYEFRYGNPREGLRDAVLALLPESERDELQGEEWQEGQIPPRIQNRISTLAANAYAHATGAAMADIARDVLGSPFHTPVIEPEWLTWNGGTVRQIAELIDATRVYGDMPILADALEDAGCTDEVLLRHCRESPVHVPGCWALDAILGRV